MFSGKTRRGLIAPVFLYPDRAISGAGLFYPGPEVRVKGWRPFGALWYQSNTTNLLRGLLTLAGGFSGAR